MGNAGASPASVALMFMWGMNLQKLGAIVLRYGHVGEKGIMAPSLYGLVFEMQ